MKIIKTFIKTLGLLAFLMVCTACGSGSSMNIPMPVAAGLDETVFRTGVTGGFVPGRSMIGFSVSPDGTRILFIAGILGDGLHLLDLKSGRESRVLVEPGRHWDIAQWSRDGKQVLALSAPIHDDHGRRYCQIEEVEVMLINPQDWSYRRLAATPGANTRPFFSADGKTVYYFKGRKRERGATPASKFDLYAYELATDRETRLTFDEMYEVGPSHDDGKEILFSVYGHRRIPSFIPNSKREQRGLYALDKTSLQLRQFHIDQQEGFFNIQLRDKDITENVYILTLKRRPGGGNYLRVIYRCNAQGNHCVMLREIPAESGVHAAFQTGEVFINDAIGNEIVFRRLTEKARVQ